MSVPIAEPTAREEPSGLQITIQEEPSGLQVTIVNLRSLPPAESDAGTAPAFRPHDCIYCSCEVAGKPQSRIRTHGEDSKNLDSGWEAVWDFTSDVPCYQMGDSLMFTIWERDGGTKSSLDDAVKCSSTDSILGRVDLTSEALAALSAPSSPGSPDSDAPEHVTQCECELPLQDAASGFSAMLRLRIEASATGDEVSPDASPFCSYASQGRAAPLYCSQSSVPRSPLSAAGVARDADAAGLGGEFADTVANQVAKVINSTFQKLLTEVLTRHSQGLAETVVAELRRSEVHVIEKINQACPRKARPAAATFKKTSSPSQGQGVQGGRRPSRLGWDNDAASTGSAASEETALHNSERSRHPHSDNDSVGHVGNFASRLSVARDAAKNTKKYAARELSPHVGEDDWRARASQRSAVGSAQGQCNAPKYSAGDMVGMQTNRILESFGLVSGPPAGRPRRPSLTEYLTGGAEQPPKRHEKKKTSMPFPLRSKSRCSTMDSTESGRMLNANAFSEVCPDGRDERRGSKSGGKRPGGSGNAMVLGNSSIDQDQRDSNLKSKDVLESADGGLRRQRSAQSVDTQRTARSAHREKMLDAAAERSTDSAAFSQSSTRMSASSIEKLRRARVKIGFVSALSRSVKKDSQDAAREQDFAPVNSKASRTSKKSASSKASKVCLDFDDSRNEEDLPLYITEKTTRDGCTCNSESALEAHGPTPDSQQISLPGKLANTSEVPRGVLKTERSFAEEKSVVISDQADLLSESSHAEHSQLDLDLSLGVDGLEPSTPSTPGFGKAGFNSAGSMHSRSLSLGASQSITGARMSMSESHNMKSMRIEHEAILMHKSTSMKVGDENHFSVSDDCGEEGSFLPALVLLLSGVCNLTEWQAAEAVCYLQLLLSIGNLIVSVEFVIEGVNSPYCGAASAVLSAGALLALISTRLHPVKEVAIALERYSLIHVFHQDWITKSKRILYLLLVIWCVALMFQNVLPMVSSQVDCIDGISDGTEGPPRWPSTWATKVFPYIAFAHASCIYLALLYCQFHILACLELMLDSFCRRLFEEQQELDVFVSEWNVLQAMLRRSARTVENCFVIVQTSALCALLLSAVGIWQDAARTCGSEWIMLFMEHVPILVLGLAALLLFCRGATVTEQCTRVPSLINSIELDDPVDETRQYVVNYIINSDAGFYVWDVRLTSFMALKITYVLLAAMFGLIVQLLKMG